MSKFVYVIWRRDGAHKIGFSRDPERRLLELRSAVKMPMKVVHAVKRTHDAYRVEGIAHGLLRKSWIGGEWFRVDADAAIQAVADACVESDRREQEMAERLRQFEAEEEAFNRSMEATRARLAELLAWAEAHPDEFEASLRATGFSEARVNEIMRGGSYAQR